MNEARAAGAQAEIDLHAVVAAERVAVEPADRAQAVAPEVEHGPFDEGNLVGLAGVCAREQRVDRRDRLPGRKRVLRVRQGIGRDTDRVGERRNDADVAPLRMRDQPVQPVVGDFRIGLQHDHVAVAMEIEATIHRGGEAPPRGLLDHLHVMRLHEVVQRARAVGAGRAVVDDHDLVGRAHLGPAHALDAAAEELRAALEGNDDVDDHQRLSASRWRSAISG